MKTKVALALKLVYLLSVGFRASNFTWSKTFEFFLYQQLIVAVLIACAAAADFDATVVRSDSDVRPDGYQYAFETSNQIFAEQAGSLKNAGTDNEELAVTGKFSYVAPDGTPISVTYTADATGYHPDNLPVGPEIPEAIARAIKLLPVVESKRK